MYITRACADVWKGTRQLVYELTILSFSPSPSPSLSLSPALCGLSPSHSVLSSCPFHSDCASVTFGFVLVSVPFGLCLRYIRFKSSFLFHSVLVTLRHISVIPQPHCYNILVNSFGLSNGLGVEGCGHAGADVFDGQEVLPGIGPDLGVTIRQDISGEAVESPYFSGEYPGEVFSRFLVFLQWYEVGHIRESVDN